MSIFGYHVRVTPNKKVKKVRNISLQKTLRSKQVLIGFVVLIFAAASLLWLGASNAATHVVSLEAESGSLSGKQSAGTTTGASNNASIKFGTGGSEGGGGTGGTSGTLPAKVVGGYYAEWDGSTPAEITQNAPGYNVLYAAFAWSGSTSDSLVFQPTKLSASELKSQINASKAKGVTWILSMGGGGDSKIRLMNETNATNIFNSLVPIIDEYGFQGLDFDIECGASCWNADSGVSLSKKLKTKYGNNFYITAAPRPYETRDAGGPYASFALKAGDLLDLYGLQFYDFNEANSASSLRSIILSDINKVVSLGIPASKITMGAITYDGYGAGHNTDEVYASIYNELQQQHPTIRGAYVWDTGLDKRNNWGFPVVVGGAVRD